MSMLAQKILYYIKEKDISYSQLSKLTGVTKSSLQRYATGATSKIPIDAIAKIEEALLLEKGTLLGWANTDNIEHSNTSPYEIPILQKYNKLNDIGQEKADTYISDLLENPKYVAEAYQSEYGYASIAADTGKNGQIPAPDFDTIIELNKDNQ